MHTKAVTSFRRYRDANLSPAAQMIHDQMLLNASVFTNLPITMAVLQTQCTDYDEKLVAKASRARADTLAFTVARETLQQTLRTLGNYVNDRAQGDATIVMQSGFPSYSTAHPIDDNPPPPPTDVRISAGPVSGSFSIRFKPGRTQSVNDMEVNLVDPLVENEWKDRVSFKSGRVELTGFTFGAMVWVRLRTQGVKLIVGDWCNPVAFRVV